MEIDKAMKEVDMKAIQAEIAKAMKEVDLAKIQQEVQAELAKVDWDKVKKEMDKVKEVDMKKLEVDMKKLSRGNEGTRSEIRSGNEKGQRGNGKSQSRESKNIRHLWTDWTVMDSSVKKKVIPCSIKTVNYRSMAKKPVTARITGTARSWINIRNLPSA
jgi:hypothetical protein